MPNKQQPCNFHMSRSKKHFLHYVILRPYRPDLTRADRDLYPFFTLLVWHAGGQQSGLMWRDKLGYCLRMNGAILFSGEDYLPACALDITGVEVVEELLGFLTMRPGDTDSGFFDGYTLGQSVFAEKHAEALSAHASFRFSPEF